MKIAIDLSPLQSGHRMRGIGSVIINFLNNLPEEVKKKHDFVFYILEDKESKHEKPLDLLNMNGFRYEVKIEPEQNQKTKKLYRTSNRFSRLIIKSWRLLHARSGDSRMDIIGSVDVFIQFEQLHSLPRGRGFKKVLVIYDLIPYVLEQDYLWSYTTARQQGYSRKSSFRTHMRRYLYLYRLRINTKSADVLIAISEFTKKDLIKYTGVSSQKVKVAPLGVAAPSLNSSNQPVALRRYVNTSWGYVPRDYKFPPETPFLLFIGGVDHRRKLDHLITAFNHLRAEERNIKLVLAGDIMQGPLNIPTIDIQKALTTTSYIDDIIFMGFVPDHVREYLYKNALVFVYPSMYEGFGLPILEAMRYGTPVITYNNSSIPEVAGRAAMYTNSAQGIKKCAEALLTDEKLHEKYKQLGQEQAAKFSWQVTAAKIMAAVID